MYGSFYVKCPEDRWLIRLIVGCLGQGVKHVEGNGNEWLLMGMVFLFRWHNVLKLGCGICCTTLLSILKTIELYTLYKWIIWYYTLIKPLKGKEGEGREELEVWLKGMFLGTGI